MTEIKSLLTEIISEATVTVGETNYFKNRGFTEEIINEYRLGYLPDGLEKFATFIREDKKILSCYKYVIPNIKSDGTSDYLLFRTDVETMKRLFQFELNSSYALGDFVGKIWNEKALINNAGKIFITETWTDALSVIQCGVNALALNRVTNIADLWKKISCQNMSAITFVTACDADYYGLKTNKNLAAMLTVLNYRHICFDNFPDNVKDCNEWLQIAQESFCREVKKFSDF